MELNPVSSSSSCLSSVSWSVKWGEFWVDVTLTGEMESGC